MTLRTERILDLADIIENDRLPLVQFNMNHWAINNPELHPVCGTTACIAGYAVIAAYGNLDTKLFNLKTGCSISSEAARILGLDPFQAHSLFNTHYHATKEQAVKTLRKLAATGRVSWQS